MTSMTNANVVSTLLICRAQRPSVEAAYALVVHCETVLKKTNEGDSLEKDTLQRLLTNAQQATEAVDAHLRDLNVDDKGESFFCFFVFFGPIYRPID